MKNILKIILCLSIVWVFAGFTFAQTKTAKGNFCGWSEGDGAAIHMRIGNTVTMFSIHNDEPEVKYIGFKDKYIHNLPVGSEIIINYVVKKKWGQSGKIVRSVTLTGKINKRTPSCDED